MLKKWLAPAGVVVVMVLAALMDSPPVAAVGIQVSVPDTGSGDVGSYTSLELDGAGNPVVSYYDTTNGDLKVLHCDDPACTSAGDGAQTVDSAGLVGVDSSLELDTSGFPVVSYSTGASPDLKILHCNDADCVGGDESISLPDTVGAVGIASSLALDSAGFPVVSYHDNTNGDLKLMHCNDANCSGGDESIVSPDTAGSVGNDTSLVLDASGFPVIAYSDFTNGDLKIIHCNDANCTGGGDVPRTIDSTGSVGSGVGVVLDGVNPVMSYYDATNNDLKILHCADPGCSAIKSTTSPDTGFLVGQETSIALDGSGNPVVSYWDGGNDDLKVMHCNDRHCAGGNESFSSVDASGMTGRYPSLALDSLGNPVVSYWDWDFSRSNLKVLHCNDANCSGGDESIAAPDTGSGNVGYDISLALDAAGRPVVSYYDISNGDLKLMHCNDAGCADANESVVSPDTAGNVGRGTSLALDAAGSPVVSYTDWTNADLKVMHCNDPNCAGGGESITAPDTGSISIGSSLSLDASGQPVIAYTDASGNLKVMHCNDANCDSGVNGAESITIPFALNAGWDVSLALDLAGNPVVAFWESLLNGPLKLLHCDDANCTGDESANISTPDMSGSAGSMPSLRLDNAGNPVVAYWDSRFSNRDLRVLHCNDPKCAGGNDSISTPDGGGTGLYPSLALDALGNAVVSYHDETNRDLMLLHCNDPRCEGAGDAITSPDSAGNVGGFTSLELDVSGNPVVAYLAGSALEHQNLRLLTCGAVCKATGLTDSDFDGCPDVREQQTAIGSELTGGRRDYLNPNDYFNPTRDGLNRVDDILLVVNAYFEDDSDGNPGVPPYFTGGTPPYAYSPGTDRTLVGPLAWNLGPPNGLQRVDDILLEVKQYFHDCS